MPKHWTHKKPDIDGQVFKGQAQQITDAQRLEHVKTLLAKKY